MSFLLWWSCLFNCFIRIVLVHSDNHYQQFTFYYETYRYALNKNGDVIDTGDEFDQDEFVDGEFEHLEEDEQYTTITDEYWHSNNDSDTNDSDPLSVDIHVDEELSIHVLKSAGMPFIMDIIAHSSEHLHEDDGNDNKNNETSVSIQYDDYDAFNVIDTFFSPDRQRRRLRTCYWYKRYFCGHSYTRYHCGYRHHRWRCGTWRWGWSSRPRYCYRREHKYCTRRHSHWCHSKHPYWCAPIAPPRHDAYWIQRWKRVGRFVAMYPSLNAMRWYNYWGCHRYCTSHYGGLATFLSLEENYKGNEACYDILIHPPPKDHANHAGNWRGHSCWFGMRRPFKKWEDKRPVSFTNWYPGEPNNSGNREDCSELYIWHGGKWNDVGCSAQRSCICQDPRGAMHGPFIGVQAMRRYSDASKYCETHYGTQLATIMTDEDNKHARVACEKISMVHTTPHCWIGLQRPFHEWDDGSDAERGYENWYPGEPNNHNERCAEIYSEHDGRWNDLACHAKRYFLCNAQSKVQRMDFSEREHLIAMRMNRHRVKWEASQLEEYRKKVRKQFFDQLKQRKALVRKHLREQHDKMRAYYREMAFTKQMNNVGNFGNNLVHGNQHVFNPSGMQSSSLSHTSGIFAARKHAFYGTDSKFIDMGYKRRRLRQWIEDNSDSMKAEKQAVLDQRQKEQKRLQQMARDKQAERDMDEDGVQMFYDSIELDEQRVVDVIANLTEDDDQLFQELEEMHMDYNVNESPKRCTLVHAQRRLYDVCINDEYVEVTKYVRKERRREPMEAMIAVDDEYGRDNMTHSSSSSSHADEEQAVMEFAQFEQYRYQQALLTDTWTDNVSLTQPQQQQQSALHVHKLNHTQYVMSKEFIYDHDDNHKKQCFNDDMHEFEICLQFETDRDDMLLYIDTFTPYFMPQMNDFGSETVIAFSDDLSWNEVNILHNVYRAEHRKPVKVKKCVNYVHGLRICVIKKVGRNKYINQYQDLHLLTDSSHLLLDDEQNEYRVVLTRQNMEDDQHRYNDDYNADY